MEPIQPQPISSEQSTSQQVPVKEPNTHQTFFLVLITLLVLIIIATSAYILGSKSATKEEIAQTIPTLAPSPTPTPDETANWETYTNSSFSFKYPSGWTTKIDDHNVQVTNPDNQTLSINFKNKNDSTKIKRTGVGAGDLVDSGTIMFGNQTVSKQTLVFEGTEKTILYNNASEIYVGDIVFSLSLDNYSSEKISTLSKETQSTADQILSTFKFTPASPAGGDQENAEGKFCGGIAVYPCPAGYTCKLDGNYPDAGGACVKQ